MSRRLGTAAAAAVAVLLLPAPPPAAADEAAVSPESAETGTVAVDESACLALSRTLADLLEAAAETEPAEDVNMLEAEGIGAVAEELLQEGDLTLAGELFREAIALLEGDDG